MSETRSDTKPLTIPIVARASSDSSCRQLQERPTHLGPWPLKRSRSEQDRPNPSTSADIDAEDHPSLTAVLARVDEDCATIDRITAEDMDGKTMISRGTPAEEAGEDAANDHVKTRSCKPAGLMAFFLGLGTVVSFLAAPIMTFVFAKADWGGIILHEQAPSKPLFGILLTFPIMSVGLFITMASACFLSIKYEWKLLSRRRNIAMVGILGLVVGGFFDLWILACIMPLVKHA